jgi:hypothetical protein
MDVVYTLNMSVRLGMALLRAVKILDRQRFLIESVIADARALFVNVDAKATTLLHEPR